MRRHRRALHRTAAAAREQQHDAGDERDAADPWRDETPPLRGEGGDAKVVRPERVVCTEAFDESWYDGEALDTTVLVERDGKTTLTTTVRYASQEVRDAVLQSPMEHGVAKSYDTLAEVLAATLVGGAA